MTALAPLAVAIPLLVSAFLAATDFVRGRLWVDVVAIATAAAVTVLCAVLLAHTLDGQPVITWLGGWRPRHGVALGISLTVDTFGAGMATLSGVMVTGALVFSARYFDAVGHLFHALMLVFLAAMAGFSLTGDLFDMFVFFELMSATAYALTAYRIEERGPLQGAINFAVTNSVGAFMLLSGITLIYARTGALNLAQIGVALAQHPPDGLVTVAFALILIGFLTKAAVVPMHFWLADAHAVAPAPVCVLFSGVMVELGLFGAARVYWTAFAGALAPHSAALTHILVWLGVATALVGAVMCVSQRHIKRLLAFSTIAHMGIFLIGFGLLSDKALAGVAMYVVAHGLAKASLFMCAGVLLHRFARIEEHSLRGCGRRRDLAPVGVTMAAGGLVLAATPMVGTFFGKSLIDAGALEHGGYGWLPAVIVVASMLTGGAVLRVAGRVFCGWGPADEADDPEAEEALEEQAETTPPHERTPASMVVPAVVLMAAAVVIGLVPGVVEAIEHAAAHFRDHDAYARAVLGSGARFADAVPSHLTVTDFLYGTASTLGALAVAALALFGRGWATRLVPAPVRGGAGHAVAVLRDLHSGHVGDYVAWLTISLAGLGGLFALALT